MRGEDEGNHRLFLEILCLSISRYMLARDQAVAGSGDIVIGFCQCVEQCFGLGPGFCAFQVAVSLTAITALKE